MFHENKSNNALIAAIIFGAILISGSLVFLGLQLVKDKGVNDKDLQAQIFKGIDTYIKIEKDKTVRAEQKTNKPKYVEGDFTDDDAVMGDKDALVTMIEFSDYQCPYCAKFFNETFPTIQQKYIDTGKVKFIYRDFPLSSHPYAYPAASFAECVRDLTNDEIYFKVHGQIFQTIANGFDYETMSKYAKSLGVDKSKLKKCFDDDKFKEEITKDQSDGESVGITGTPGFIINNKVFSGAQPFSYFEKIIEDELAKAK